MLPVMHTETNLAQGPRGDDAVAWLRKQWANALRVGRDGVPLVGFTWYALSDQVAWDTARVRRPDSPACTRGVALVTNARAPRGVLDRARVAHPATRRPPTAECRRVDRQPRPERLVGYPQCTPDVRARRHQDPPRTSRKHTMTQQTVLLVGATGMFGSHIARHLLDRPEASVRLMVRTSEEAEKQATLEPLRTRGAEIVFGDLCDGPSLDRATQGVDVIVSAVQGGPDVIVDGQVALAEAGARNGVRRILPSDYALDLFKTTPGEHMMFDLRRHADAAIAAIGIEHVHVLQGAFMDMFRPGMGTIDLDAGIVSFWGDGTRPIEMTSVEDTAVMVARVALDRTVASGKFAFAGDHVSILDATAVIEGQSGRTLERRSLGTEADLRAALAEARGSVANPFAAVMLAYQLYMLTGQTALSNLQNDRYADVQFESFAAFADRTLPRAAFA